MAYSQHHFILAFHRYIIQTQSAEAGFSVLGCKGIEGECDFSNTSSVSVLCVLCFIRWLKIHCCERAQIHIYIPFTNISFIIGVPLSTLLSQPTSNLSVLLGDPQESLSPNFLFISVCCHMKFIIEISHGKDKMHCHLASSQFAFSCWKLQEPRCACNFVMRRFGKKNLPQRQLAAQPLCVCVYVSCRNKVADAEVVALCPLEHDHWIDQIIVFLN